MKSLILLSLPLAAVLLSGCATYREGPPPGAPPPLTLAEIKEMSARGVSDGTILTALRASHAVYRLSAQDIAALQEARVSPAVIDYLLKTPELSKAEPPRYRTYYYYYPPPPFWYWHDPFWFGWHYGHHGWHH
ncbi:MAG: hypothetical protein AAB466_01750 [Verrucomicrobiota bacterium]